MQSIIVEVHIPALSASFDFRIPSTGRVREIVAEIIRILEATQSNVEFDRTQPMLCDLDRGIPLPMEGIIARLSLRDGAQLLLV